MKEWYKQDYCEIKTTGKITHSIHLLSSLHVIYLKWIIMLPAFLGRVCLTFGAFYPAPQSLGFSEDFFVFVWDL